MIELISEVLLWFAGIVTLIGAIGMLRFPDFYTRCHAATMVTIGGFSLALIALMLQNLFNVYFFKIFIVLFANFLVNPTATHALADAAYRVGVHPFGLVRNDLEPGKLTLEVWHPKGARKAKVKPARRSAR